MPEAELLYMGRPVKDLSREELIEAIHAGYKMYQNERRMHGFTRQMEEALAKTRWLESWVYTPQP